MIATIAQYFKDVRNQIIAAFEQFEPQSRFQRTPWSKASLGSGEIGLLRGHVFEKAAVNFSFVSGDRFPMLDGEGHYQALGTSLITHMVNPFMPTAHFNIRFIQLEDRYWFGGGFDLTPMGFEDPLDTHHFHQEAQLALDSIDPSLYPKFKEEAKNYFFIPHRGKERGIGGIFFDHYATGSIKNDFELIQKVGDSFLKALIPIYKRKQHTPYSAQDKATQNQQRAHYVEFNLIYDRGTKFGFASGGNPEAILCSMPPSASW